MRRIVLLITIAFTLLLSACAGESNNELVVGLECNYAPFNWTTASSTDTAVTIDGLSAQCDGYDVQVASYIADELDRDLVLRKIEWDGLIPALLADEIDLIIAGMSPTPERAETVSFTDQYYRSEQVLVVDSSSDFSTATTLADFSTASVIAQMGTLQDGLIDQIPDVNHMDPLADYPSLVASLTSGVSDALVAELPVAQAITASNTSLSIVSLGDDGFTVADSDVSVSVALRQEDTELLSNINDVLATLSTETRTTWMNNALSVQPD